MSKIRTPWTPDEEKIMLDAIRNGGTFEQIAKQHERTATAIKLRFGMMCKKQLCWNPDGLEDLVRTYHLDPKQIHTIIDELDNLQQKKPVAQQHQQQHTLPIDLTDIMVMKEQILVMNDKLVKIHKYIKNITEVIHNNNKMLKTLYKNKKIKK